MLCRSITALRLDGNHLTAIPLRCKSWPCPGCGPRRKAKLIAEILSGSPNTFLTLTWKPRPNFTPNQAASLMSRKFSCLVKRIRLTHPNRPFQYALVWEATKQGWPHLHIVCRAPYIPQKWLSAEWAALTGSPIVDIRAIKDQDTAARYVSKYVSKGPHQFAATKRYRFSQDYRPTDPDRIEFLLPPESGWLYANKPIDDLRPALVSLTDPHVESNHPDLYTGTLTAETIRRLDGIQINSPGRLDHTLGLLRLYGLPTHLILESESHLSRESASTPPKDPPATHTTVSPGPSSYPP